MSPAVSRDKVSSYTPLIFSFTVPLRQTLGQSAAARTTRRPRQFKNTFLKGGGGGPEVGNWLMLKYLLSECTEDKIVYIKY